MATALFISTLASQRPVAGVRGRFHLATDTNAVSVDNGISWDAVSTALGGGSGPTFGLLTDRPASANDGAQYHATDVGVTYMWVTDSWKTLTRSATTALDTIRLPQREAPHRVWIAASDVLNKNEIWRSEDGGVSFVQQGGPGVTTPERDTRFWQPVPNVARAFTSETASSWSVYDSDWFEGPEEVQGVVSGAGQYYSADTDGYYTVVAGPAGIGTTSDASLSMVKSATNVTTGSFHKVRFFGTFWIAVSVDLGAPVWISETGLGSTWTLQNASPAGARFQDVEFRDSDGMFWFVDYANGKIWRTLDFTTWVDCSPTFTPSSIARNPVTGRLATVQYKTSGANQTAYSDDDGDTWTTTTTLATNASSSSPRANIAHRFGQWVVTTGSIAVYNSLDDAETWNFIFSTGAGSNTVYALNDTVKFQPFNTAEWLRSGAKRDGATTIYDFVGGHYLDAALYDQSGNTNDLLLTGGNWAVGTCQDTKFSAIPAWTPDGTQVDTFLPYTQTAQFTVTLLVRLASSATVRRLVAWNDQLGANNSFVNITNSTVDVRHKGTDGSFTFTTPDIAIFTVVQDATHLRVYVNGAEKIAHAGVMDPFAPQIFDGFLAGDELLLFAEFDYALTPAEVLRQWKPTRNILPA